MFAAERSLTGFLDSVGALVAAEFLVFTTARFADWLAGALGGVRFGSALTTLVVDVFLTGAFFAGDFLTGAFFAAIFVTTFFATDFTGALTRTALTGVFFFDAGAFLAGVLVFAGSFATDARLPVFALLVAMVKLVLWLSGRVL